MKRCRRCGIEKTISEFNKYSASPDGIQYWCKECARARNKERYHADRTNAIERVKAWARNNPEKVAENMRSLRRRKGEEGLREYREYRRRNKDRYALHAKKKRAKRQAAISATVTTITLSEWNAIKTKQKGRCFYCGKTVKKLTMDHVVPLVKGGEHSLSNIVAACLSCNCSKGKTDYIKFQQRNGKLL